MALVKQILPITWSVPWLADVRPQYLWFTCCIVLVVLLDLFLPRLAALANAVQGRLQPWLRDCPETNLITEKRPMGPRHNNHPIDHGDDVVSALPSPADPLRPPSPLPPSPPPLHSRPLATAENEGEPAHPTVSGDASALQHAHVVLPQVSSALTTPPQPVAVAPVYPSPQAATPVAVMPAAALPAPPVDTNVELFQFLDHYVEEDFVYNSKIPWRQSMYYAVFSCSEFEFDFIYHWIRNWRHELCSEILEDWISSPAQRHDALAIYPSIHMFVKDLEEGWPDVMSRRQMNKL